MSEAELMQNLLGSIQVIMSLFSVFFTIISAYIAGLFFFLNRAPMALRLLAFRLLSVGLVFLGTTAATQQRVQEGLFASWSKAAIAQHRCAGAAQSADAALHASAGHVAAGCRHRHRLGHGRQRVSGPRLPDFHLSLAARERSRACLTGRHIAGTCHCGAIRGTLAASKPAAELQVRACQCGFCTRHGAMTVSDPAGRATFEIERGGADALSVRHAHGHQPAVRPLRHVCRRDAGGRRQGVVGAQRARAWPSPSSRAAWPSRWSTRARRRRRASPAARPNGRRPRSSEVGWVEQR